MIQALYRDFACRVLHEGNLTPWFAVETGVKVGKQGYMLPPLLIALDYGFEGNAKSPMYSGIRLKLTSILGDLDYVDDLCLPYNSGARF